MSNLVGIFVGCTYLEIVYEEDIAVGFILTQVCKIIGSIHPFKIMAVTNICSMVAIFA